MASVKILTHLAFQRNVQPVLDAIQPYVVVLMHHSSMMYGLPVTCRKASSPLRKHMKFKRDMIRSKCLRINQAIFHRDAFIFRSMP